MPGTRHLLHYLGYGDGPAERIEIVEAERHEVTHELHESEGPVYRFTSLLGLNDFRIDRFVARLQDDLDDCEFRITSEMPNGTLPK